MSKRFITNILSLFMLLGIVACSEATSKPTYKFRKNVGDGIAAKMAGITITEKELFGEIELELYRKELEIYDIKFNRMKAMMFEKLIKADPKHKGMTNDQYLVKYIYKNNKISEKDINAFIKKNKVPVKRLNPQIKERIKMIIGNERKKLAMESWIAVKTKKSGIDLFFKRPTPPTYNVEVGNAPYAGGKDAKVTIVEFSDFQCPYCSKAAATLKKLKEKYGNKIKVVFKQYPLPFHNHAKKAAGAALCANEQGTEHFWAMHDEFFLNQANLAPEKVKTLAKRLGLKPEQFNKCFDENKYIAQIEKDIAQGKSLNVKGTPAFFVNGMVFIESGSFEKFVEFIDQELKK